MPPQPGYVRLGRRYLASSFIYATLIAILVLGYTVVLVVYPAVMNAYYASQALPAFQLDSPFLASYSGRAQLLGPDGGLLYEGDINQAVIEGEGLLYAKGKLRYSGSFKGGRYEGEGRLYSTSGSLIYEGAFFDNLYEGTGRLYERGNLHYAGDFVAGVFEGRGRLYASTALIYEGQFVGGLYNGEGIEYNPETGLRVFAGTFSDGERTADGTLYDDEGNPVVIAPGYIDPTTYLSRPYEEIVVEFTRAGRTYTEADVGTRRLVAEDATGLLLAFDLDDDGAPNVVCDVYLTGKSSYGSLVVGGQIEPGEHKVPQADAADQYALVLSNSLWGRDLTITDLALRDYSTDDLKVMAFYLPETAEDTDDAGDVEDPDSDATDANTDSEGNAGGLDLSGGAPTPDATTPDAADPAANPDSALGSGTTVFIKISREGA
jgi:hypothetical protein